FFSSRRRHTRFSRDWSSDVCSSDLVATRVTNGQHHNLGRYSTDDFSSAAKINNLNHIIGRSWSNPSPDRQVFWNGATWSVLPTQIGRASCRERAESAAAGV